MKNLFLCKQCFRIHRDTNSLCSDCRMVWTVRRSQVHTLCPVDTRTSRRTGFIAVIASVGEGSGWSDKAKGNSVWGKCVKWDNNQIKSCISLGDGLLGGKGTSIQQQFNGLFIYEVIISEIPLYFTRHWQELEREFEWDELIWYSVWHADALTTWSSECVSDFNWYQNHRSVFQGKHRMWLIALILAPILIYWGVTKWHKPCLLLTLNVKVLASTRRCWKHAETMSNLFLKHFHGTFYYFLLWLIMDSGAGRGLVYAQFMMSDA